MFIVTTCWLVLSLMPPLSLTYFVFHKDNRGSSTQINHNNYRQNDTGETFN
jgi:hypothetical protein